MTNSVGFLAHPEWIRVGAGVIGSHWLSPASDRGAGCLIVPSVGHEDQSMHRGIVLLARRLAATQHVVMLQHWATDQSDGSVDDPRIFEFWRSGVRAAIDTMITRGITDITVLSARLGALIALGVVPHPQVRRIVLWSPITSGRRFARELRVLQATGATAVDTGGAVNVGGYRYPAGMLADISHQVASPDTAPAPLMLVLDHEARRCDNTLLEAWRAQGTQVDLVDADDIGAWADRSIDWSRIPFASLRLIEQWINCSAAPESNPPTEHRTLPTAPAAPVTNAHGERQVVIESSGLQVVLARPASMPDGPSGRLSTILYSTLGPGRTFVELARRETARGRQSLRVDARGWRWSPPRQRPRTTYQTDTLDHDDLREAERLLGGDESDPKVLIGFCLGALSVLRLADDPGVRGVVAINPPLYDLAVDPDQRHFERHESKSRLVRRMNYAWRFLVSATPVVRRLRALTRSGIRVMFLFDDDEPGYIFWRLAVAWRVRRSLRQGMIVLATNQELGHNLEGADTEQVLGEIGTFIDEIEHTWQARTPTPSTPIAVEPTPVAV